MRKRIRFAFLLYFCYAVTSIIGSSQREIGDNCVTSSGESGTCARQTECVEHENAEAAENDFAETCKLHPDGTPIICCVPKIVGRKTTTTISSRPSTFSSKRERDYEYEIRSTARFGGDHTVVAGINAGSTNNVGTTSSFTVSTANASDNVATDDTESRIYTGGAKRKTHNNKQTSSYKSPSSKKPYQNNEYSSTGTRGGAGGTYDPYYDNIAGTAQQVISPSYSDSSRNNYYDSERGKTTYESKKIKSTTNGYTNEYDYNRYNVKTSSPSSSSINRNRNSEGRSGSENVYAASDGILPNGYDSYDNNPDVVYYPGQTTTNQRPANNYYPTNQGGRPSSNYYPSINQNGGGQNSRPQNTGNGNSWNNQGNDNRRTTTTTRRTVIDEEPIWGTTQRPTSTTRRSTNSGFGNRPTGTGSQQSQRRISEQKCTEYTKSVTSTVSVIPLEINGQAISHKVQECSYQASSLIVGGSKAALGEYPHMVAIGFRSGSTITYNCGGTLISEEYVMTAAHCTHSSLGNPVAVRLGDLNLVKDDDGAQPVTVNVAKIIVHPNYKQPQLYNDIALIRLGRRVLFDKNLRPACLQTKREINSEKLIATGWGSTNYGEISSDDLLKVELDVINNNKCNQLYGPDQKFQNGITNSILCAGELSGKKDTCQGDSGGPLSVHNPTNKCVHYVVGITSSGKSCGVANSPGIYTRVSDYVPWIESIVWRS